jgi:RimJ/RimL family protein N-acetyltransferase
LAPAGRDVVSPDNVFCGDTFIRGSVRDHVVWRCVNTVGNRMGRETVVMEKFPVLGELQAALATAVSAPGQAIEPTSNWRDGLPVLTGRMVSLRELQLTDARSLLTMLTTEEVAKFISPPPTTVEGFERFISWSRRERERGNYVCFAVVPQGLTTAVGIFQIRQLEAGFATAEWGFALGSEYWGTGMFVDGGKLAVEFAFDTLGVYRLEARAAVVNGRGNGALRKIGAVQEAILRRSFLCDGRHLDQVLWSILKADWRLTKPVLGPKVQVH